MYSQMAVATYGPHG